MSNMTKRNENIANRETFTLLMLYAALNLILYGQTVQVCEAL